MYHNPMNPNSQNLILYILCIHVSKKSANDRICPQKTKILPIP